MKVTDQRAETRPTHKKRQSNSTLRIKPNRPQNLKPEVSTVWVDGPSKTPFGDDYTKIAQIGQPGQFGRAFRVKRNSDGHTFAVKEICKVELSSLSVADTKHHHLSSYIRSLSNSESSLPITPKVYDPSFFAAVNEG